MIDISTTIDPKTEQVSADSLLPGPITITVTRVVASGSADQPISIYFEGDDNKPYKPCKSCRRILFQLWGKDGASYVGKRMKLFRDPAVKFGGEAVGGVRIAAMSDIGDKPVTLMLTVTRGSRKPYVVEPLRDEPKPARAQKSLPDRIAAFRTALASATTEQAVKDLVAKAGGLFEAVDPDLRDRLGLEVEGKISEVSG